MTSLLGYVCHRKQKLVHWYFTKQLKLYSKDFFSAASNGCGLEVTSSFPPFSKRPSGFLIEFCLYSQQSLHHRAFSSVKQLVILYRWYFIPYCVTCLLSFRIPASLHIRRMSGSSIYGTIYFVKVFLRPPCLGTPECSKY